MLILSLGVPRSGTILVFNVLREILEHRNIEFRTVNTNYPETTAFLEKHDFSGNVLMHAHNVLPAVQKVIPRRDVITFFNYRDPRDVLVSMMKLHDESFEKCLELTEISFNHLLIARRFPRIMFIPYTQLMSSTEACIFQIAQKLGIFLSLKTVSQIREATSLEAHKKVMQDVSDRAVSVQVRKNPKRELSESTTHFINDRHIQSGESGRWQRELTAEQQRLATDKFLTLLKQLGFEVP